MRPWWFDFAKGVAYAAAVVICVFLFLVVMTLGGVW